ncbi:MAG: septum formation initiator family protein [Slackia sp.]|nr:septum formation initiator family protein [Slackia sp.]
MARKGNSNIISFDDARRMASARASIGERGKSDESSLGGSRRATARSASYRSGGVSVRERSRFADSDSFSAYPPLRSEAASSRFSHDIQLANSSRYSSSDSLLSTPRPAIEVYDERDAQEDERPSRESHARDKRRAKKKQKAERLFARQFGSDDALSPSEVSRAAVYKGEMGRSHKRAFADLESGRASDSTGMRRPVARGEKTRRASAPPMAVLAGVVACAAFALLLLFPPARQFYVESREQARLQAEYDALSARNEAIESQLEYLKTDEGIEDAAHKELGWVYDGQTAGVVQGLDEESASSHDAVISQIKSGSVPAPETWYSPMLDMVFGYVDPAKVIPENTDLSNVSDVAANEKDATSASAS